jgi:hypothetical protein
MVSPGTRRQQRTVSRSFTILPSSCVLVGAGSLWLTFHNLFVIILQPALLCPCVRHCPSRGPILKYGPDPRGVHRGLAHISGTPEPPKGINWHKDWPSDWGRLMALKHCPCMAGFYVVQRALWLWKWPPLKCKGLPLFREKIFRSTSPDTLREGLYGLVSENWVPVMVPGEPKGRICHCGRLRKNSNAWKSAESSGSFLDVFVMNPGLGLGFDPELWPSGSPQGLCTKRERETEAERNSKRSR